MAHTPGPWHVEDRGEITVVGPDGDIGWCREAPCDFSVDDARLIAAAPALLEAAHAVRDWAETLGEWEATCWAQLNAAIHAAEGPPCTPEGTEK